MKKIKLLTVVAFLEIGIFLLTPAKAQPTYQFYAGELYMTTHEITSVVFFYKSYPIATGVSCR